MTSYLTSVKHELKDRYKENWYKVYVDLFLKPDIGIRFYSGIKTYVYNCLLNKKDIIIYFATISNEIEVNTKRYKVDKKGQILRFGDLSKNALFLFNSCPIDDYLIDADRIYYINDKETGCFPKSKKDTQMVNIEEELTELCFLFGKSLNSLKNWNKYVVPKLKREGLNPEIVMINDKVHHVKLTQSDVMASYSYSSYE